MGEIERYAPENIFTMLISSKSDLEENRVVQNEEEMNLCDSLGLRLLETSAKTNTNIDQIFNILTKEIMNLLSNNNGGDNVNNEDNKNDNKNDDNDNLNTKNNETSTTQKDSNQKNSKKKKSIKLIIIFFYHETFDCFNARGSCFCFFESPSIHQGYVCCQNRLQHSTL